MASLGVAAKQGLESAEKVKELTKEVKSLTEENKTLSENFNTERVSRMPCEVQLAFRNNIFVFQVLRKKYYNMVEDMKGKIRVYCRVRPMSSTEKANVIT